MKLRLLLELQPHITNSATIKIQTVSSDMPVARSEGRWLGPQAHLMLESVHTAKACQHWV